MSYSVEELLALALSLIEALGIKNVVGAFVAIDLAIYFFSRLRGRD